MLRGRERCNGLRSRRGHAGGAEEVFERRRYLVFADGSFLHICMFLCTLSVRLTFTRHTLRGVLSLGKSQSCKKSTMIGRVSPGLDSAVQPPAWLPLEQANFRDAESSVLGPCSSQQEEQDIQHHRKRALLVATTSTAGKSGGTTTATKRPENQVRHPLGIPFFWQACLQGRENGVATSGGAVGALVHDPRRSRHRPRHRGLHDMVPPCSGPCLEPAVAWLLFHGTSAWLLCRRTICIGTDVCFDGDPRFR